MSCAPVHEDEHRILILHVLERALIDACFHPPYHTTQEDVESAEAFLFDDDYLVQWGDLEVTPRDLLDGAGLDLDYIRRKARDQIAQGSKERRFGTGNGIL